MNNPKTNFQNQTSGQVPSGQQRKTVARLLLVDDDRSGLLMLQSLVEDLGYSVETATNGAEAFAMMRDDPQRADLIVTDRMMPVMDGLALTRRLKRDPETADIPIVLVTGANQSEDIAAGIEAGAFYYLVKPVGADVVGPVLESAMKEVWRKRAIEDKLGAHQTAFGNIDVLRMTLSTPGEIEPVCSFLASLHPRPETVVQGIFELVQNGIEHGLLGFGFAEKARLLASGGWERALADRSRDAGRHNGQVEATMMRKPDSLVLTVKDPGPGFNWQTYMTADPSRSSARNGRGIARANAAVFDKLVYVEPGNEVRALMRLEIKAKW